MFCNMLSLHILSALCCLCIASGASLPHRRHPESSYTTPLQRRVAPCNTHICALTENEHIKFLAPVTFGTETFLAEIDTGSSDTWISQTGFKCHAEAKGLSFNASEALPEKDCNFGATWTPNAAYSPVPDIVLYDEYGGSGARRLEGPLGHENVTFCGLNVPQQLVGAPNMSTYAAVGLAEQSGLVGLAFPALTSAYNITAIDASSRVSAKDKYIYNNVPESLFNVEIYTPALPKQFAFVISRDVSNSDYGGSLTIGGIPKLSDPKVNASSAHTSAPLQKVGGVYKDYAINVTSFVVGGAAMDAGAQVIVDSGTPILIVPPATANAFNKGWSPACTYVDGVCALECDAKNLLSLGVTVGNVTYDINPVDLKIRYNEKFCYSAVDGDTSDTSGKYVLGDTFFRNVVAVFDWGNKQMSFYPRMHYKS